MESYLVAEISASAIQTNISLLRRQIAPATKFCPAVKADCYGHGLELLLGVVGRHSDCLAVATPSEGLRVRELGYERPVLVFFSPCVFPDGAGLDDALAELIARDLTLTVVSSREVDLIARQANRLGKAAGVHVKIDSGMGRSGVPADKAPALVEQIRGNAALRLTGMYTHFATADEEDKSYTLEQLDRYLKTVEACGGRKDLTLHTANSSAIIDLPQTHLDMVRPGIALYGYQPSLHSTNVLPLRPALRLMGRLMQIKDVPSGSRCGYGLQHTFSRDSRIGLLPIGYADGYFRAMSNRGHVRIRGRWAPVRGRISMDQTIIDLTDVPDAAIGDEVEIISNDPQAPNSVESIARMMGTIPHEVTCRLGGRVRRKLVD